MGFWSKQTGDSGNVRNRTLLKSKLRITIPDLSRLEDADIVISRVEWAARGSSLAKPRHSYAQIGLNVSQWRFIAQVLPPASLWSFTLP